MAIIFLCTIRFFIVVILTIEKLHEVITKIVRKSEINKKKNIDLIMENLNV